MKSLVHTEELCSQSVPLEHAPGAKSLVCIGLKNLFALAPYTVETQNERYQSILWKGERRWWLFGNFVNIVGEIEEVGPAFSSYSPFPSWLLNQID